MGTTDKARDKAKAKVAKMKEKVARKSGKAKKGAAAAVAALALAFLFAGCASSESAQPAKSQTLTADLDHCTIIIAGKVSMPVAGTNQTITAEGEKLPTVELLTQTQSLESSGTESFAQTSTQTPTTDIKPDVDVHYNDAIKNATDASKGVLESLATASANKVLSMMASKETGTVEVEKTDGTKATVECKDGQCSICTDCTAK